jgi:hypothetical protein
MTRGRKLLSRFSWNAGLFLFLCLTSCKPAEREIEDARPVVRPVAHDDGVAITKAPSWCEAKLEKAKLTLPSGFQIKNCSTWSVDFSRPEKGPGSRLFGKLQLPWTNVTVWLSNHWPEGMLEGPMLQIQGRPGFEENAVAANGGPNQIPDVSGLRKAMEEPTGWDTHAGADDFKYYYFTDDRSVFCEGFIRQDLSCGIRGGRYFMTWSYSGRDIEASLKEMLAFRRATANMR